jgi:hypothetical protein
MRARVFSMYASLPANDASEPPSYSAYAASVAAFRSASQRRCASSAARRRDSGSDARCCPNRKYNFASSRNARFAFV